MKNKIIIILAVLGVIILSIIIMKYIKIKKESKKENIIEYIPQQELSDEELRKTIIALYFKDIETNALVPETKCIDVKELSENPYYTLLEMLLREPESEKLESAIPENTKINGVNLKGNTAYVDVSKEFIENAPAGIEEESIIIYSIVNTLTELNEITSVKILINGEENLSFKDGKITFEKEFFRND